MSYRTYVGTAIVVAAAIVAADAAAQEIPKRKSGLWEITIENGKGTPARTMSQCVDQAKDEVFRQMGHEAKCGQSNIQRSPGGLSFESSCDLGNMKVTSQTKVVGDFDKAYQMEIHSKYSPPMMGMSEGTVTIAAKHLGACKAGQRPGDMTMQGGMTMNIYDMMDAKKK